MRQWPDLTGQRFGMLVVTAQAESTATGQRRWVCRCDCGNERIVMGSNLKRGTTVSCGCKRYKNLEGQKIGKLTVIGRSDKYGSRGKRKTQLWECKCECGAITYKATDTLTNPDISMCQDCANKYAASKARANAGFKDGTQLTKIVDMTPTAANTSGVRGVYYEKKINKWRARLRFKGKTMSFGTFTHFEDAVFARKEAEKIYFGEFLEANGLELKEYTEE